MTWWFSSQNISQSLENICQAGIFSAATYLCFETFLRDLKTHSREKPRKAVQIFAKRVLSLPLHICVLRWWFSSLENICQAGIISTAAFRDGGFLAVKVFAKLVLSPPPHICIALLLTQRCQYTRLHRR